MTTFLLVHGGWYWRRVTPLLEAAGHRVLTPTLTGLGERAHLCGPRIDLDTHIEDVANPEAQQDTVHGTHLRCLLSRSIQYQQLMLQKKRFGDDCAGTAGSHGPDRRDDQMSCQDETIPHTAND